LTADVRLGTVVTMHRFGWGLLPLALVAVGSTPAVASPLPAECVRAAGVVTCTYTVSGSSAQLAIPAGAADITILADGAPGGLTTYGGGGLYRLGGNGAEVSAQFGGTLAGQTLTIQVGEAGHAGGTLLSATGKGQGGWPNGGAATGGGTAGGGGGASFVTGSSTVVVAGGGGGAGDSIQGVLGGPGGPAGGAGSNGTSTTYAGGGGGGAMASGATPGGGGAAGLVLNTLICTTGSNGGGGGSGAAPDAGTGGTGHQLTAHAGGGGGGGGYAGGGGGGSGANSGAQCSVQHAAGGGGGGGSSFVSAQALTQSILEGGQAPWSAATGRVVISYRQPPNLVHNGGFEKPVVGGFFTTFAAPARLGPWRVTAGSVDVVTSALWPPVAGSQAIDLAGNEPGTIQQQLTLPSAGTYKIAFKLAGNPDCGPQVVSVAVLWNGVTARTFSFDTSGHSDGDLGWIGHSLKVSGAGPVTVGFANVSPGSCGATLDAVTLKQVG
jgi:uncharacterized protein DUF642